MPTPQKPIDISEYEPDEATADEMAERPAEYNKNVDPALRARLDELRRRGSSPSLPRIALPSVTAYVPPTEIREAPRPEAKVEVVLPPAVSEYPTQPSLRRLHGEPEVPGVVKGARGQRPISARAAALAVLAVLAPVVLVIVLMGRGTRKPERDSAPPAATGAAASASATVSVAASPLPPTAASSSPAAPVTATPASSATASTTATAVVPVPTGAAPKPRPKEAIDDPYDASVPAPPPSATAAPSASVVPAPVPAPSTTPPAAKSAAPTAPTAAPDILH